jgi:sigma-E factor negative regulatory protein RseC
MKIIEVDGDCGLDTIRHSGVVKKVDEQFTYVSIISQSACASCHAKGACNITDLQEEVVEIPRRDQDEHQVGDRVEVVMRKSLGTRAVMLGYGIPFLLVIGTMITVLAISGSEGLSGLLSLGILIPYYLLLYLRRGRLKRTFTFSLQ